MVIENTRFVGNSAVGRSDSQGGGLKVLMSDDLFLDRVEFRDNRASRDGAAVYIRRVGLVTPTLRMVNVLAANNSLQQPHSYGAVLNMDAGAGGALDIHLSQVTVAENPTPAAIRIAQEFSFSYQPVSFVAHITNTLVTSATYGLVGAQYPTSTLTIDHNHTLFYSVTHQTAAENGTPIFNGNGTVLGDPKLDANQRLQAGSAAIDAGVDSGVTLDLDGGARPAGAGYDIGADEYSAAAIGSFRFGQATYAVPEGNTLTVTVERIGGSSGTVSVQYATSDGTAQAGSDYTAASGTLTFASGEISKTITLTTLQDNLVEGDETLVLSLSSPTGGAALSSPNQAVVTIQDDDTANRGTIHFAQSNYTVTESAGVAVITVVRTGGSSGTVSVQYATSDGTARAGSDYTATSGTLTFADGETSKTFTVTILNDALTEGQETVQLILTNATGGAVLGTPNLAVLTISDSYRTFLPLIRR